MTQEKEKGFFYYLNPFVWIKGILSYLLTILLLLNHYFVFILMGVIASVSVLFTYDRYAAVTYVEDTTSDFLVGSFARSSAYDSPLKQGDKKISNELSSYYQQEARREKREKEERLAAAQAAKNPNNQVSETVSDMQPIWRREDEISHSFIQQEVNKRLADIEKRVVRRRK